jgi:hypothetical protein
MNWRDPYPFLSWGGQETSLIQDADTKNKKKKDTKDKLDLFQLTLI